MTQLLRRLWGWMGGKRRASEPVIKPWRYRFVGLVPPTIQRHINRDAVDRATVRETRREDV